MKWLALALGASFLLLVGALLFLMSRPGGWAGTTGQGPTPPIDTQPQESTPAPPTPTTPSGPYLAQSTQAMAERLETIVRFRNPEKNPYDNERHVTVIKDRLLNARDVRQKIDLTADLVMSLLFAGRTNESLRTLLDLRKLSARYPELLRTDARAVTRELFGLAYLRLGEQENSLQRHSTKSCLLPIEGAGVHIAPRGSQKAIEYFTTILEHKPSDLRTRWLLNLAHNTLGQHPQQVPPAWLIRFDALESGYDIHRFPDAAPGLGLGVLGLSGGSVVDDFDGDGYLDIMASSWGLRDQLQYFHNNADGSFTNQTTQAGLTGLIGGLNLCHADYNNDGYPDVLVLRGAWLGSEGKHPNSLLKNNGDGTFDDVTEAAKLLSFHPTQTAAWGDFDNDGWVDLFIGNETASAEGMIGGWAGPLQTSAAGEQEQHPCELYRNNGDGTFTECAALVGVDCTGFVKGVTWGDYDNDGRLDLYISRLGQPNVLYKNNGPIKTQSGGFGWSFDDVTTAAGVGQPVWSFPTWFFDYNNDGWLDIFVAGYRTRDVGDVAADYTGDPRRGQWPRLYKNNGDGTFTNVTRDVGLDTVTLPMGANFGDLDNDGFLDLYLGTGDPSFRTLIPNRMFRNDGGRQFQDVTISGGFGHLQKGHGIAFADIDNDGDQDIYAVIGGAFTSDLGYNVLFLNPGHANHWVTLILQGVQTNRAAIGARIKVTIDLPGGSRDIYVTVGSGGSFGASSLRQEIGLAQATGIRRIEITWPVTEQVQTFANIPMDQIIRIREGEDQWQVVELRQLDFTPALAASAQHEHQREP